MKEKPKYKRTGRCNGCGVCCLFKDNVRRLNKKSDELKFKLKTGYMILHETKKLAFVGRAHACPQLMFNRNGKYRCKLHGKRIQPMTCRDFPFDPTHDYYTMVKKFCGYRFEKVGELKPETEKPCKRKDTS